MVPALTAHYGDHAVFWTLEAATKVSSTEKLAGKLQAEQNRGWRSNQESPTDVFHYLGLDRGRDTVLSSPKFSDWLKYFNTFNHENSSKKEKLLDPFQRYFRARGVTKIADDAMKNPSTREIGRQLKVEQLDRWLGLEYDPEDVFHSLFLNKPGMPSSDRMAPDGTFYTVRLNTVPDNLLPAWILNFGLSIYETLTRSTPTGKRQ
ncbi:hypothetical protein GN958_ATG16014 [Phytophthora infestans]|uniref:RxLR effector PexRD54 WY domain-containing protein n=1 Tax=Phytophthora infestans TaxID=4787 RepID=A0A8S9U921_PHYIN|nr:hypothetical protein GN958_ATG16014 [Phytophthora infestans]